MSAVAKCIRPYHLFADKMDSRAHSTHKHDLLYPTPLWYFCYSLQLLPQVHTKIPLTVYTAYTTQDAMRKGNTLNTYQNPL